MENGPGRDAVHGVVNCRSSARIRVCSALRFLPWKLPKSIKCCYIATSLKCWVLRECVWPCSDPSKDCEQSWPIYLRPFAGVLAECFTRWRMSLELRLLACGRAWIVSVSDWNLRVLLFLLFWANLCSCAQNSIPNRQIVAYNLTIDLIGLTMDLSENNPTFAQKSGSSRCGQRWRYELRPKWSLSGSTKRSGQWSDLSPKLKLRVTFQRWIWAQ